MDMIQFTSSDIVVKVLFCGDGGIITGRYYAIRERYRGMMTESEDERTRVRTTEKREAQLKPSK